MLSGYPIASKHSSPFLQEVVTLKTAMVKDATAGILEMHSIPAAVSKDLTGALPGEQIAHSSHEEAAAPADAQS